MRRLLAIFLILLFPLQLSAGAADWTLPTHASAKERLILAESKSLQSDVIADQKSASEWDASDELPASADIGDTLIEGWYGEQVRYLRFAMAGYAEPAHPLLFLPLFKPPPI